jgi:hypothetical protein
MGGRFAAATLNWLCDASTLGTSCRRSRRRPRPARSRRGTSDLAMDKTAEDRLKALGYANE